MNDVEILLRRITRPSQFDRALFGLRCFRTPTLHLLLVRYVGLATCIPLGGGPSAILMRITVAGARTSHASACTCSRAPKTSIVDAIRPNVSISAEQDPFVLELLFGEPSETDGYEAYLNSQRRDRVLTLLRLQAGNVVRFM
ncbi:uncharacterized protein LAESUDRAFT_140868 [Laetiporus sulphureus 93-53]|uniref:Uncharacterized protein n=1 Tax=Laetiporus sulphureus 93-53 TaxID=1314785 RepID=A0A165EEI3_9APHY|nr:uncharacterized protein LAESUDRAFT_140868 [Laetiporus sulphureus 93-53]KZT06880.1 hypothetical protein LAESUDRAFT_140868 [Laetiporus sulphureus 93-53]